MAVDSFCNQLALTVPHFIVVICSGIGSGVGSGVVGASVGSGGSGDG
jgi:hypothetical protein